MTVSNLFQYIKRLSSGAVNYMNIDGHNPIYPVILTVAHTHDRIN